MTRWLPLILGILGIFLHLVHFGSVPVGVNRDEAALGYNAYSLLKTGRDERGISWPLQFESFGDWKAPVYFYLAIPFIALGGLTETTVRLPALFAAIAFAIALVKIAQAVLKDYRKWYYLVPGLLLITFNPWLYHFSRVAYEATVAIALVTWGTYLFHFKKRFISGALMISLALFTYHAAIIVVPLLAILIIAVSEKQKTFRYGAAVAFLAFSILLIVWRTFFTAEQAKGQAILLFNDTNENLYEAIYKHRTGTVFSALRHNKITYYTPSFIKQWLQNFSPQALLKPAQANGVHDLPTYGRFLLMEYLLAIAGVIYLIRKRNRTSFLLLGWLLIAPIPAAITKAGVHTTRTIFLLPIILLLALIGMRWLVSLRKKLLIPLISALLLIPGLVFVFNYLTVYPNESESRFNGYYKPLCQYAQEKITSGNTVMIATPRESPYIFCAFYNQIDPAFFQDSIKYYRRDDEGFQHARELGVLKFPEIKTTFAKAEDFDSGTIIFSRPASVPDFVTDKKVWNNRLGKTEFFEWHVQ